MARASERPRSGNAIGAANLHRWHKLRTDLDNLHGSIESVARWWLTARLTAKRNDWSRN